MGSKADLMTNDRECPLSANRRHGLIRSGRSRNPLPIVAHAAACRDAFGLVADGDIDLAERVVLNKNAESLPPKLLHLQYGILRTPDPSDLPRRLEGGPYGTPAKRCRYQALSPVSVCTLETL